MKRSISITLIILHLVIVTLPTYLFSQQEEMKIIKVLGSKFAANKGSMHGVSQGSIYIIIRNSSIIARAKVFAVREKICALKIIEKTDIENIQTGDKLVLDYSSTNEIDMLLNTPNMSEFSREKLTDNQNYYYIGEQRADTEYSGGGAVVGGLVAGTLLGLIGWGLGYAIMSGSDIDVPPHHLTDLSSQQQFEFSSGYKTKAKKKRNGNYHAGAAIGTLIAVVIVLNASQ